MGKKERSENKNVDEGIGNKGKEGELA